jgi:hypothetical protein
MCPSAMAIGTILGGTTKKESLKAFLFHFIQMPKNKFQIQSILMMIPVIALPNSPSLQESQQLLLLVYRSQLSILSRH